MKLYRAVRRILRPLRLFLKKESQWLKKYAALIEKSAGLSNYSIPNYIVNWVYYVEWRKSHSSGYDFVKKGIPWVPFIALPYLRNMIKPSFKIFEYGSGGSTIFFASRVKFLGSVEHNIKYFNVVNSHLEKANWADRVQYFLVQKEDSGNLDFKTPSIYAEAIEKYPDEYFDVVFVDAIDRNQCLYKAKNKVRPGGWIILDNADRKQYKNGMMMYDNWPSFIYYGPCHIAKSISAIRFWNKPLK